MAGSDDSPPGYAPSPRDPARAFAVFAVLTSSALVAAGYEVLVHQAAAYLEPGFGPSRGAVLAGALLGGAGAWLAAWRAKLTLRALPWLFCALSLLSTSSALLWFYAFAARQLFPAAAYGLHWATGALLGASLFALSSRLIPSALELGGVRYALQPFRLFFFAIGSCTVAGLLSVIGLLRSAAILGAVLAVLALWSLRSDLQLARSRGALALSYAALAVAALAFGWAERLVPLRDLRDHPAEIVHTLGGERQRHVVVSSRATFELFSERMLRASSLDAHRYAESLAHPALGLAPSRTRVLLLGAADGLIEREVLRYRDVETLTVVTLDATLERLARRAVWSPGFVRGEPPPDSRLLRVIEAEPIVWLGTTRAEFDVVLVDLPDPVDYREGKNYTLHFYRRLRAILAPGGSVAVQVTSPQSSPAAFSSIVQTLREASFDPRPYAAPVASLGVWGFVLARPAGVAHETERNPEAERVLSELRFLSEHQLSQLFRLAPDARPLADAPFNTLPHQPVVELLNEERARLGM